MIVLTPEALEFIRDMNTVQVNSKNSLPRLNANKGQGVRFDRNINEQTSNGKLSGMEKFKRATKLLPKVGLLRRLMKGSSAKLEIPRPDNDAELQYLIRKVETRKMITGTYIDKAIKKCKEGMKNEKDEEKMVQKVKQIGMKEPTGKDIAEQSDMISKINSQRNHNGLSERLKKMHHLSNIQVRHTEFIQSFVSQVKHSDSEYFRNIEERSKADEIFKKSEVLSKEFYSVLGASPNNKRANLIVNQIPKKVRNLVEILGIPSRPIRHQRIKGTSSMIDKSHSKPSQIDKDSSLKHNKKFNSNIIERELSGRESEISDFILMEPTNRNKTKVKKIHTE